MDNCPEDASVTTARRRGDDIDCPPGDFDYSTPNYRSSSSGRGFVKVVQG
jgi:hypothetical protein